LQLIGDSGAGYKDVLVGLSARDSVFSAEPSPIALGGSLFDLSKEQSGA
jgi:hypothetical protein